MAVAVQLAVVQSSAAAERIVVVEHNFRRHNLACRIARQHSRRHHRNCRWHSRVRIDLDSQGRTCRNRCRSSFCRRLWDTKADCSGSSTSRNDQSESNPSTGCSSYRTWERGRQCPRYNSSKNCPSRRTGSQRKETVAQGLRIIALSTSMSAGFAFGHSVSNKSAIGYSIARNQQATTHRARSVEATPPGSS
jgi:hypothetical protein